MNLQEVILCASVQVSPASGSASISLHDIQTGAVISSFKQSNAKPHCTAVVESQNSQGGFVFSTQPDKPILNVYNYQKVCHPSHWESETACNPNLGSNQPENGSTRKTDLYCRRHSRCLLRWSNRPRTYLSVGGESE